MASEFNFTDENGIVKFRIQTRDDGGTKRLCTDMVLTATGFNGTENVDWENLEALPPDE